MMIVIEHGLQLAGGTGGEYSCHTVERVLREAGRLFNHACSLDESWEGRTEKRLDLITFALIHTIEQVEMASVEMVRQAGYPISDDAVCEIANLGKQMHNRRLLLETAGIWTGYPDPDDRGAAA